MSAQNVAVVLGGTGGIGSEVAQRLAGRGDLVYVAARTGAAVRETAERIAAEGRIVDATDAQAVADLMEEAAGRGRLTGVVHAVGSLFLRPAHLTRPEDLHQALETNLVSAFNVVRAAAPLMRDAGGGSLVLFSSAASRTGLPNHEAIAAAKGGVAALARSAAATYAPWRVRVNAVAPGLVRTPLTRSITENEKAREASLAMHPIGRLGSPADVADAVMLLLAHEAWITGEEISVDGGLAALRSM